jgi:type II secretory pathway pseudopilin PulG
MDRDTHKPRGFTLVEAAITLIVVALLITAAVPLVSFVINSEKSVETAGNLARIYTAIVGTPATGNFGYLGDVGEYPTTLMDLIRSPGSEGWNGPYLSDVYSDGSAVTDPYGTALEYFYSKDLDPIDEIDPDYLAIIAKGPDRSSTNTSVTPNSWSTFVGILPSSPAYETGTGNEDNIVFPRFTGDAALAQYNNVGQLNLSIFNWDHNPAVSLNVPGCPNRYEVKVTSLTRPTDTWGTASAGTTPTYSPGGATFDLIQGIYKLQIRSATTPNAVYFDDTVSIMPGATQVRTVNLQDGPNSSTTPNYVLNVKNNLADSVTVYTFNTLLETVISGATSSDLLIRGCAPVTVRDTATNQVIDSFAMPIGINRVNKVYSTDNNTYKVTNNSGSHRYLFIYRNDLLIGEVSGWGKLKSRTFDNFKNGDRLIIKNQSGTELSNIPIAGSGEDEL